MLINECNCYNAWCQIRMNLIILAALECHGKYDTCDFVRVLVKCGLCIGLNWARYVHCNSSNMRLVDKQPCFLQHDSLSCWLTFNYELLHMLFLVKKASKAFNFVWCFIVLIKPFWAWYLKDLGIDI